jgi:hypothetical protein
MLARKSSLTTVLHADVFVFAQWATTTKQTRDSARTPRLRPSAHQNASLAILAGTGALVGWAEYTWPSAAEHGVVSSAPAGARGAGSVRPCGGWDGRRVGPEVLCTADREVAGLAQYWSLRQCSRMVEAHERATGVRYTWLIRSRADAEYDMGLALDLQPPHRARHLLPPAERWPVLAPFGGAGHSGLLMHPCPPLSPCPTPTNPQPHPPPPVITIRRWRRRRRRGPRERRDAAPLQLRGNRL